MEEHGSKSPSFGSFFVTYAALMALLTLTVVAAHYSLGPVALLIALSIASAKAVLIILQYMHVRYASRVTWIFVVAGFVWLMILFSMTFAEYAGRTRLIRAQPLVLPQHP